MDYLKELIKKQEKRIDKVRLWDGRIKKLSNRKIEPMSEAEFCRRNGLHNAAFNRQKNGFMIPTETTVTKVEKALLREGV